MTQVVEIFPHVRQEINMSADVLATQGATVSASMILTMLNLNNLVSTR